MSLNKEGRDLYPTAPPVIATAVPITTDNQFYSVNAIAADPVPNIPAASLQTYASSVEDDYAINEQGARQYLTKHEWPNGLIESYIKNSNKFAIRFWICDDSGSMGTSDGTSVVKAKNSYTSMQCTRWHELTECLRFHAGLAHASNAKTEFFMLNNTNKSFIIGGNQPHDYHSFLSELDKSPSGRTPLVRNIRLVTEKIRAQAETLRANGQMAALVIASDGESSDGDVAAVLQELKDLPVWIVIRLCTDSESVVNYWNRIDANLEIRMDILDDLFGECKEVTDVNNWLTYGLPLHRYRESVTDFKEFDLLDEQKLTGQQIRKAVHHILGGTLDEYPQPDVDLKEFLSVVASKDEKVWCPKHRKMQYWIRGDKLKSGCAIM